MQKLSNTKEKERSNTISSILDNCITIEKYTEKKYKELSENTDNERAKQLFDELSKAGNAHSIMLTQIKDALAETGEISNSTNIAVDLRIPKKENIPEDSGVKQTYLAMKKHLNLEKDFETVYAKLSKEVKNPTAQGIFQTLSSQESSHHKRLRQLIKAFEEVYKMIFENTLQ